MNPLTEELTTRRRWLWWQTGPRFGLVEVKFMCSVHEHGIQLGFTGRSNWILHRKGKYYLCFHTKNKKIFQTSYNILSRVKLSFTTLYLFLNSRGFIIKLNKQTTLVSSKSIPGFQRRRRRLAREGGRGPRGSTESARTSSGAPRGRSGS